MSVRAVEEGRSRQPSVLCEAGRGAVHLSSPLARDCLHQPCASAGPCFVPW